MYHCGESWGKEGQGGTMLECSVLSAQFFFETIATLKNNVHLKWDKMNDFPDIYKLLF